MSDVITKLKAIKRDGVLGSGYTLHKVIDEAIAELEKRTAAEPVAWLIRWPNGDEAVYLNKPMTDGIATPLYAAPAIQPSAAVGVDLQRWVEANQHAAEDWHHDTLVVHAGLLTDFLAGKRLVAIQPDCKECNDAPGVQCPTS